MDVMLWNKIGHSLDIIFDLFLSKILTDFIDHNKFCAIEMMQFFCIEYTLKPSSSWFQWADMRKDMKRFLGLADLLAWYKIITQYKYIIRNCQIFCVTQKPHS